MSYGLGILDNVEDYTKTLEYVEFPVAQLVIYTSKRWLANHTISEWYGVRVNKFFKGRLGS